MGGNKINGAEAGKAMGDAIAANTVLKELDLSNQGKYGGYELDAAFAKEFAVGLGANGALVKFDLSNNMPKITGVKNQTTIR